MFYEDSFMADPHDDAALVDMIREMLSGPARTELDPLSFDSMVAFHRSLRGSAAGPFVVVTSAIDDAIAGEVSPESTVRIVMDGAEIRAEVDGFAWTANLLPGWREAVRVFVVAATEDGSAVTEVDLHEQSFSHSAAP